MINNENRLLLKARVSMGSAVKSGISFGTCLAMVISFVTWKSVGWAILHGISAGDMF